VLFIRMVKLAEELFVNPDNDLQRVFDGCNRLQHVAKTLILTADLRGSTVQMPPSRGTDVWLWGQKSQ